MKYSLDMTFYKDDEQYENVLEFNSLSAAWGIVDDLFFPNHQKAPWHVQLCYGDQLYNFWPHKLKGHIAYTSHVIEGRSKMKKFMHEIVAGDEEELDVIE